MKDPEQLASANSLGLVAAFGTFPLGAVMFAALAGDRALARRLPRAAARSACKQESLAIWVDGVTFLVSAFLISRLRLDETERGHVERASRPRRRGATSRTGSGSSARTRSCAA